MLLITQMAAAPASYARLASNVGALAKARRHMQQYERPGSLYRKAVGGPHRRDHIQKLMKFLCHIVKHIIIFTYRRVVAQHKRRGGSGAAERRK